MKIKRLASFFGLLTLSVVSALMLTSSSASAATDTCTWTGAGGDNNVSTAANWAGCDNGHVPQNGDLLHFTSATPTVDVNNDSLAGIATITVDSSVTVTMSSVGDIDISGAGAITIGQSGALVFTSASSQVQLSHASPLIDMGQQAHLEIAGTLALVATDLTMQTSALDNSSASKSNVADVVLNDISGVNASIIPHYVQLDLKNNNIGATYDLDALGSIINVQDVNALGNSQNTINLVSSQLNMQMISSVTVNNNITINGNLFNDQTSNPAGNEAIVFTHSTQPTTDKLTLAGSITLASDVHFNLYQGAIEVTGPLSGAGKHITVSHPARYLLTLSSSNNTSDTPNGDIKPAAYSNTVAEGDNSSAAIDADINETLTIDGQRGDVNVYDGGVLKGHGTVGVLAVLAGGHLAPGNSPGCLNAGNTTLASGSNFDVEIGGATACTEYDQLKVTGTVDVTGASLNLSRYNNFSPAVGQTFTIIDNDSNDAVTGTFSGLAQGATFQVDGYTFSITYTGGDGNDVVITVTGVPAGAPGAAPGTPNTGIKLLLASPLLTLTLTTAAAAGLVAMARKYELTGALQKVKK